MKKNMDVEWGYSGERGPEHWGELCDWFAKGAEFSLQSPIPLAKDETISGVGEPISFHYRKQRFTDKEFKNTIHLVPFDQISYVVFNDEKYYLTDIHFHMPSEHVIHGKQEAIEFHFVHMNARKENLVVGAMYQLVTDEGWLYDRENGDSWDVETHEHWTNPAVFFPEKKSHYHYVGSLTTPPTSGPIQWFVMDKVGKLNKDFLIPFKGQYAQPNNRPLQPLKNRTIHYYEGTV
ncbi:carbonic anhydrase [Enterococcus sp. 10A9_DIV0425]|uniref:carbonic anhydrase n=1 Tax=Candidatus Enterococcus wittei TaxID=1987383 RepID=A0A2C9XQV8_9ENTE|nr:carbonic anhydrase family protein [Enterococcus sp. 10A9_DIV0425]OTP11796.1 carbonic anhydrase [Enterococcus sp. 10A9_DIV0425]